MGRFEYIQKYMENGGSNAKKLVDCMVDYAKTSLNEATSTKKFDVVTKYTKVQKAEEINKLYLSEIERRSKRSLSDLDGNIEEYASFGDVAKMGAFLTTVLIDTIYPIYLNESGLARIAEFHQVGAGGVAKFTIKDSTLYNISKMGRRQKHTKVQEKKKNEVIIETDMYGLTTESTLPKIMMGDSMIADEIVRMALSINNGIYKMTLNAFINATNAITDSKYKLDSYTEGTFLEKVRNATAINGSSMTIVGDRVALKDLLPATSSLQILLTDAYNTNLGYMDVWNGYNVVAFDVVADDEADNGVLGLPTSKIYAIPNDGQKLVHVAIGTTRENTDGSYENNNLGILSTLAKEIGVKLATSRKVVRCDLATD